MLGPLVIAQTVVSSMALMYWSYSETKYYSVLTKIYEDTFLLSLAEKPDYGFLL